jgi:hypothetical protein
MHIFRRLMTAALTGMLYVAEMCFASSSPFDGYTFVFSGSSAYLYGMDKQIIHQWDGLPQNAFCADLLRDSSLLWASSDRGEWRSGGVASGGRLKIIKWDGTIAWDFLYRSADYMPHHDMEPVYYTNDPKEKPNILVVCYTAWGDKITELKPTSANTAEVVWEWYASDHTCDSGTGTDKPELIDKGKGGDGWIFPRSDSGRGYIGDIDRMHTNNVSFNRTLNQIAFSAKSYCEVMVIDHSTTTAEAKGHTGGRYGKGGDILYRWGMPENYGAAGDSILRGEHCGSWIPDTFPGTFLRMPDAFNLMCIDNCNRRVVEWVPPGDKDGVYPRPSGEAFEPAIPRWTYEVSDMSSSEGYVQRLPNGNTFICTGGSGMGFGEGRVFEVDPAGNIVWELADIAPSTEGYRYAYGYLTGEAGVTMDATPDYSTQRMAKVVANPLTGWISLASNSNIADARLSLFGMDGRKLVHSSVPSGQGWDLGDRRSGQYLVQICAGAEIIRERVVIGR